MQIRNLEHRKVDKNENDMSVSKIVNIQKMLINQDFVSYKECFCAV